MTGALDQLAGREGVRGRELLFRPLPEGGNPRQQAGGTRQPLLMFRLADLVFEQLQVIVGQQRELLAKLPPGALILETVHAFDDLGWLVGRLVIVVERRFSGKASTFARRTCCRSVPNVAAGAATTAGAARRNATTQTDMPIRVPVYMTRWM